MSWTDCATWLARLGLALPTEARWEHACRAGTRTPWWTGAERESLRALRAAILADRAATRAGAVRPDIRDWPELDDDFPVHAPVGSLAANAFGLHDMAGNLWEWCADGYDAQFFLRSPRRDPECPARDAALRIIRGGAFLNAAHELRSAHRSNPAPSFSGHLLGVRPARAIALELLFRQTPRAEDRRARRRECSRASHGARALSLLRAGRDARGAWAPPFRGIGGTL